MSWPSMSDMPIELHANLMRLATISSDCRSFAVSVMARPFMAERPPDHDCFVKANHLRKMTQELGWLVRNKGGLTSSPKPGRGLFFSLSLMETAFIK
ncbi:hypothetical protein ACFP76_22070 [Paracoccus aerius]